MQFRLESKSSETLYQKIIPITPHASPLIIQEGREQVQPHKEFTNGVVSYVEQYGDYQKR